VAVESAFGQMDAFSQVFDSQVLDAFFGDNADGGFDE